MRYEFNVKQRVDEFGQFITQWPWKIWATFSFKSKFPVPLSYLTTQWGRLISRITEIQRKAPYWVRSIEIGREHNNPHIHVLLGNIDLPARELPRLWHPNTGNAQAETYDPEKRAAWYIAKHPESVEFSENLLPPAAHNRKE